MGVALIAADLQSGVSARKERTSEPVSGALSTFAMPGADEHDIPKEAKKPGSVWQYGRILVRDWSRANPSEALVSDTTPSLARDVPASPMIASASTPRRSSCLWFHVARYQRKALPGFISGA